MFAKYFEVLWIGLQYLFLEQMTFKREFLKPFWKQWFYDMQQLTLPMLRLLPSKAHERKSHLKPVMLVFIGWYSQMSTHVGGFQ